MKYGIFLSCFFFFLFSSPNLSNCRLDVYHISTHGVDLEWISNAGLKCAACSSLEMQDPKIVKNSPSGHHRTTLLGYIFATKARTNNWKKYLLNSNISYTCPHNMVHFGPLAAEISWRVWGTPANFNGFCILAKLAALLHSTLVVGISQTLQHWTEDATYIRQGGHHIGHWPTILVSFTFYPQKA